MKCPSCNQDSLSKVAAIFATFDSPVKCRSCDEKYWVHRILSKVYMYLVWFSGLFLLIVLLFSSSAINAVFKLLVLGLLHILLIIFEFWLLGLKKLENEK